MQTQWTNIAKTNRRGIQLVAILKVKVKYIYNCKSLPQHNLVQILSSFDKMKDTIYRASSVDKQIYFKSDIQVNKCTVQAEQNNAKEKLKAYSLPEIHIDLPDALNCAPLTPKVVSSGNLEISNQSYDISTASIVIEQNQSGCGWLNFSFFRILFWGILISGGDVFSDFLQVRLFCIK